MIYSVSKQYKWNSPAWIWFSSLNTLDWLFHHTFLYTIHKTYRHFGFQSIIHLFAHCIEHTKKILLWAMGKYDNSIPMARSWEVYIFEKFSMSTLFYEAYRKKFMGFFAFFFSLSIDGEIWVKNLKFSIFPKLVELFSVYINRLIEWLIWFEYISDGFFSDFFLFPLEWGT